MKKNIIEDVVITKIKSNDYLKSAYAANYLITINHDIIGFSDTLKDAQKQAIDFIEEQK